MQLQFWFDQGKDPLFQSWKKEPQQENGDPGGLTEIKDNIANDNIEINADTTKINVVDVGSDNDITPASKEDLRESKVDIEQDTMMEVDDITSDKCKKKLAPPIAKMTHLKSFPVHEESKLFNTAEVRTN